MRRFSPAIVAATLILTACEGTTDLERTVNGMWSGSSSFIAVDANLVQTGVNVAGTGTVFSPLGDFDFSLTGVFVNPDLSATLTAPGYESMTFAGTLDGNTLTGTLNGNGLVNYPVTLTRAE